MPPIAILVALADPTRCRLIALLRDGPQPVHVLAAAFTISRPAISRHLRVLKQSGLISETKLGRENRYKLHTAKLAPVQRWLSGLMPEAKPSPVTAVDQPVVGPHAVPPKVRRPQAAAVAEVLPVAPSGAAPTRPPKAPAVSQMGFDF